MTTTVDLDTLDLTVVGIVRLRPGISTRRLRAQLNAEENEHLYRVLERLWRAGKVSPAASEDRLSIHWYPKKETK